MSTNTVVKDGSCLYSFLPPKLGSGREEIHQQVKFHLSMIESRIPSGLVVYDLQDESFRTSYKRPFPFRATMDGESYTNEFFSSLAIPIIVYRAVGKYSLPQLDTFFEHAQERAHEVVLVGAPSSTQVVRTSLTEAYTLCREKFSGLAIGGVVIPERHAKNQNEHRRLKSKIDIGCQFFISQAVYNTEVSKQLLLDYKKLTVEAGKVPSPIAFTFVPCGNKRTLAFMKWLGVSFSLSDEHALLNSTCMLKTSMDLCIKNWLDLKAMCENHRIPMACNIESISSSAEEKKASMELLHEMNAY